MRESTLGAAFRNLESVTTYTHTLTTRRRVALAEPAHFIVLRGMMVGIRDRAEAMMGGRGP